MFMRKLGAGVAACVVGGMTALAAGVLPAGAATPTWATQASYPPVFTNLLGISCSSTTHCVVVGPTKETTAAQAAVGSGSSWARVAVPAGIYQLTTVACPSATVCVAGGSVTGGDATLIYSTDGGSAWSTATEASNQWLPNSMSCSSASDCMAVGSSATNPVEVTKDGGKVWTNGPVPAGVTQMSQVSCVTGGVTCVAVGFTQGPLTAKIMTYSGTSWKVANYTAASQGLNSVACPSADDCIVVGQGTGAVIARTTNGGTSWSAVTVPTGITDLYGVSCLSATACVGTGENQSSAGAIVYGSISTGTFKIATTPAGADSYNAVSCAAGSTDCTAASYLTSGIAAVATSSNSGSSWTAGSLPLWPNNLDSVSCGSITTCIAGGTIDTGATVDTTTDAGTVWTPRSVAGMNTITSVVCLSSTDCDAVGAARTGGTFLATTNGGTSWTQTSLPTTSFSMNDPVALSCRSVSDCVVIGDTLGGIYESLSTTNGTTFTPTSSTLTNDTLDAISCSSTTDCVAVGVVGSNGLAGAFRTTNFGSTWTPETVPESPAVYESLLGVSCPSTLDCEAVGEVDPFSAGSSDTTAFTTTDGGTTWIEHQLSPPASATLDGISCYSTSDCVAVGVTSAGGKAIGAIEVTTDGGTAWTSDAAPSGSRELLGVACLSTIFCESVGVNQTAEGAITIGLSIPLVITTSSLPSGTVGKSYSSTMAASGGTSPYTWSVISGTKPPGLSLSTSGAWSGKPTTAGTYSFTVEVTDKIGTKTSKALKIVIAK